MVDVPNVPGVPSLLSYAQDAFVALAETSLLGYGFGLQPQWGIYLNGSPIVIADSVVAFDMRVERALSNYPIERGGFETYNKVAVPYLAKIQFASGGDAQNRADLIQSVNIATDMRIGGKPAKFDVITPEIVYLNCSISHNSYRRAAGAGLGLVVVDVWVQEVREQSGGVFDSASTSGAETFHGGNVQPEVLPGGAALGQGGIGHA